MTTLSGSAALTGAAALSSAEAASPGLLGDVVYSRLVERIFSGELAPGTALSVPALATDLAVSRSPVRESVQRLIAEGLAVHTPHAGARVAQLTDADFAEVMAVRELLDGYAARQAAERARTPDIARLTALLENQAEQLAGEPDPVADSRLDLEFHTAVRDLAANRTLSDALHRLDARAHLYNSGLWADRRAREIALHEHRKIVDAIEAGDVTAAERAAAGHVAALLIRMRRSRQTE